MLLERHLFTRFGLVMCPAKWNVIEVIYRVVILLAAFIFASLADLSHIRLCQAILYKLAVRLHNY